MNGFLKSALIRRGMSALALLALAFAAFGSPQPARADTVLVVTSNADDTLANLDSNNSTCDLREAMYNIEHASSTYGDCPWVGETLINFAGNYTITLVDELPVVTVSMGITGNGAANTIIQASTCDPVTLPGACTPATYRVFDVYTGGDLTLSDLTVQNGNCTGSCVGWAENAGGIGVSGGTLTLSHSTVTNNVATTGGGGIYGFNSTVNITNGTSIAGNSAAQGGGISSGDTITVTDSSFANNHAGSDTVLGFGGAINAFADLTISGSVFTSNTASDSSGYLGQGGAIGSVGTGTISITDSLFYNNSATYGGAIDVANATVRVLDSTFDSNLGSPSGDTSGGGGGIHLASGATVTVTNSTFTGNTADDFQGAAIWSNSSTDELNVVNSTISGNTGGFGLLAYGGTLRIRNTILADTVGLQDCGADGSPTEDSSNNLIETNSATIPCGGVVSSANPKLRILADNGGTTQTMALIAGSPAIDTGDDSICAEAVNSAGNPTSYGAGGVDQRGMTRPLGAHCDIGAYEGEVPFAFSDFEPDGMSDPAVFEKATGNWFAVGSTYGFLEPALNFGNSTDYVPVPGDYDGDGITDAAVYEKATGNWFVVGSHDGFFTPALGFGGGPDYTPVAGDYDGDGKTDPAVFEQSTGNWFVVGSTDGFFAPALNFGNGTQYTPVPGDYDGDGKTDPAVFENATGNWFAVGSTDGFITPALNFGNNTDYMPVPGDYDGDGTTDPAVFELTGGNWFVVGSTDGYSTPALNFGNLADYIPQQGDYDGDGKTDPGLFERTSGNWFVVGSTAGFFTPALNFGNSTGYIPVVRRNYYIPPPP